MKTLLGKCPLGRHRRRQKCTHTMGLRDIRCEDERWKKVAQGLVLWLISGAERSGPATSVSYYDIIQMAL